MFHAKDGWFFTRHSDGKVAIEKRAEAKETSPLISYGWFTPEEWASIVASVSAKGEENGRWQQVLDFHNGENSDKFKQFVCYECNGTGGYHMVGCSNWRAPDGMV